ncbi:MAG: CopG family antitoxin [Oxalobacter formigenes]|nr:CopG family antitoxin [Oxalobacter formigenes]
MMKIPEFKTDTEAGAFLEQDLHGLEFRQFKPMRFEILPKDATLNMRIPAALPDTVSSNKGIPYARYVRMLPEADLLRYQ